MIQIGILLGIFFLVWRGARKNSESRFRYREADRKPNKTAKKRLLLEGIRLNGTPWEILGVSRDASAREIQRAYREMMKRYHPDKIGHEATEIAAALNRAKEEMLKALR